MNKEVFLRDRVSPNDHGDTITFFNVALEIGPSRAGWISNDQTSSQMNRPGPILHHLLRYVLYVSAGTATAGRVANQLKRFTFGIAREATGALLHCPKALATPTCVIPIADDDPYLHVPIFSWSLVVFYDLPLNQNTE